MKWALATFISPPSADPAVQEMVAAIAPIAEPRKGLACMLRRVRPPADDTERYYTGFDVEAAVVALDMELARGEAGAVHDALALLEQDPFCFRSGYARERLARRLARTELTTAQKARARTIVLSTVEGHWHCPHPGVGRLAGAVADNKVRRELRARLHRADGAMARRALRMIVNIRHPGLSPADIAAARALVLADAAQGLWLSPTVARLATYLWADDWEGELRGLLPHHGPDRAAAKRLVNAHDLRRQRRPGP
jgi:hypothetical protein